MPSFSIHHLGLELEITNGYLKPEFPPEGNNSADFYDYGNDILLGVALGLGRLQALISELPAQRFSGSAMINLDTAIESAHRSVTALQNDPTFDCHKSPGAVAPLVHMLHALASFHAHAIGKADMYG